MRLFSKKSDSPGIQLEAGDKLVVPMGTANLQLVRRSGKVIDLSNAQDRLAGPLSMRRLQQMARLAGTIQGGLTADTVVGEHDEQLGFGILSCTLKSA